MSDDRTIPSRVLPINFGPLKGANAHARITGPCGDTMEFWLFIEDDRVEAATYTTDGCQHSILCGCAAAALALEQTLQDVLAMTQQDVLDVLEGIPEESQHCGLLAANTLKAAAEDYRIRTRRAAACDRAGGDCGTCEKTDCDAKKSPAPERPDDTADQARLQNRLQQIKHKIVVLSGKGGVGKSTVAVNLAAALAARGNRVGLLDVDIHGPSVPTMLGLGGQSIQVEGQTMIPVALGDLKVMSIGFLLRRPDDAIIWRGPLKMSVIQQFLRDVDWGELDYLIVDCPPGTGDEPLSVCQLLENPDGAVAVTTPQEVAAADVSKSINFCRQLNIPVLGVVENMSGFACPKCGEMTEIFRADGGRRLAETYQVPFLGTIPIDPAVGTACDAGVPFMQRYADSATARALEGVVGTLLETLDETSPSAEAASAQSPLESQPAGGELKIALPVADGKLNLHFGHCEAFVILRVDPREKTILQREQIDAPPHEPGLLPRWLAERGVNLVIAGGMGGRAQGLFAEQGIQVIVGAPCEDPETLVRQYLDGTLQTGANACDH